MFILSGKSCSGKNEVSSELERRGYKREIIYTTRPIRTDEKQHIDYHFISKEAFEKLKNEGFFIDHEKFDTNFGEYYYGTSKDSFTNVNNKKFIILTPGGIKRLVKNLKHRPPILYLFANSSTISRRLKERKDNKDEAKRRMSKDNEDFKNFESIADRIVYNNYDEDISKVVDKIELHLKRFSLKGGDDDGFKNN